MTPKDRRGDYTFADTDKYEDGGIRITGDSETGFDELLAENATVHMEMLGDDSVLILVKTPTGGVGVTVSQGKKRDGIHVNINDYYSPVRDVDGIEEKYEYLASTFDQSRILALHGGDSMSVLRDKITEGLKSFTPQSQDGEFRCLECKKTKPVKGLNVVEMCRENRWPKCCDRPMTLSCAAPAVDPPKRETQ